ncbi:MAG TPA: SusC/RagA family TonB-linked outer membrane protein [Ferruginibacter sp.]|nr:SusC/RagA family TonB-linked outer membrane protein [Ferruginibacter sp.]
MRKLTLTLSALFVLLISGFSQKTITGVVVGSGNSLPIPGVSVISGKAGAKTDASGRYSISVANDATQITFSAVGYSSQTVSIGSQTTFNIVLQQENIELREVVVTALGIARDKRSLGYASQNIKGDELANRGEVNIANALQGKVAGVNITSASGGAGSSVNINIRGISSFTGSNQPLFVIDGIPISNDVDRTNSGPNGTLGDNQPANRALDIDMNNVESINILKGPAAAALYGSRASAGALIITTKRGGNAKGKAEIIFNSNYSFQDVFGLPKVQNEYGQGAGGVFNPASNNSFGPRFGSAPSITNGLIIGGQPVQNYRAYPDNINEFFRQGTTAENNITLNTGDAVRNQTLSIGNVSQKGILYGTHLKRTDVRIGANAPLGERMKIGVSLTYTNTVQQGTLGGNNSGLATLLGLARNIDLTSYRVNGTWKNNTGNNNYLIAGVENPYFAQFENPLTSNLNRFIGHINVSYDLYKWLNISYRLGGDMYTDRRKQVFAITSGRVPLGNIREEMFFRNEINGDLIIRATRNNLFHTALSVTGLVGQNINQRKFQNIAVQADQLAANGFFNTTNGSVFTVGSAETSSLRRLVGYYGQVSFNYNNYAFLELTGRADQSSTLPVEKNTYFYPSANISLVFTDAFRIKSNLFSYGKIRASYAKVGRDADPYLLNNVFVNPGFGNNVASVGFPFGTVGGFGASSRLSDTIPLSPEFKTSYEAGINLQFFKNRVSLDVTYYNEKAESQILNLTVPPSSGFRTYTTNIGELTNKGIEITASATVIQTRNFTWDLSANFTKQKSMVVSIAPGVDNSAIPGSAFTGSIPSFKVGYPYGVIIGGLIPRAPDGQRLINPSTGTYQPTVAGGVLADPNPEYQFGVTNTLNYKGFSLGCTFDFTKGGQILSFTAASYKARGALDITAVDREQPHILPGVIADGTGKYRPNNIQISGQTYWSTGMGGLQSEFNVFDATVFHLRELTLGYNIPADIVKRSKLSAIRFGIFARNVFYVAPNSPIDPQLNTQGAGNIRGLDLQGTPNARSIGANLKITL